MNLLHLQPHVTALDMAKNIGHPFVVGARLLPLPDRESYQMMLLVKNISRESWLEEKQMVDIVRRISGAAQIPLIYGGHTIVGRTPDMFLPYTDVEVFTTWEALDIDDALLKDKEIAQGVSALQNGRALLWGWLPGHVIETIGEIVKVKTVRAVYGQGCSGDTVLSVNYNAPWLRLVKDPGHTASPGLGEEKVRARA